MSTNEIMLIVAIPVNLYFISESTGILNEIFTARKITKKQKYIYFYLMLLCPAIMFLMLNEIKNKKLLNSKDL